MGAETQPTPHEGKSALAIAREIFQYVLGAVVVLGCLYAIAWANNHVDLYSPTTTAVGGFVASLALLWPLTSRVTGLGALHEDDTAQAGRLLATFGVTITLGGVLADGHLGLFGIVAIGVAAVISFILVIAVFFGLSVRRQKIEGKQVANQSKPTD